MRAPSWPSRNLRQRQGLLVNTVNQHGPTMFDQQLSHGHRQSRQPLGCRKGWPGSSRQRCSRVSGAVRGGVMTTKPHK
jgi:hypothetical protein